MTERLPTEADFEKMLAGILPASISPEAQASAEAGIREYIRKELADQMMTEEDMEQMGYTIQHYFQKSLVPVGEAVGPLAALSTGEPATQMQLSAHRVVGTASKTTNEGIPRFQELLRATLQQKAVSSSIFFTERHTLSSVRQLVSKFVYRTLGDFLEYDGAIVKSKEDVDWKEEWHEDYRILYNYREETPNHILRLRLNREEILRFGLTPDMIVDKLKATYPEPVYVYSPVDIAIIDVYAKRPSVSDSAPYITEANALAFYLRDILIPSLKQVHMTGIPRISAAFPRQQELTSFIASWKGNVVIVDTQKAELQGVHPEDLIPLLEATGYEPQARMEGDRIILGVGGGSIGQLGDKILQSPELRNLNGTWFLETNGSNLSEILAMDIVNAEVSFSTDINEIYAVFGIQAARDYLLEQFITILSSDSYMDPRHLILLADVMTNTGLLAPTTSAGVSRQKIGPLTRAAFERPVEHFLVAAGFGEIEKIRGVAASVFVGKPANIGPEAFMIPKPVKVLEQVDEEGEEGTDLEIPDTLALEDAIPSVLQPPTAPRSLPVKISMYDRKTVSADVEIPDVLTLEAVKPVVTSSNLPPRRIGLPPPPARRQQTTTNGPSSLPPRRF